MIGQEGLQFTGSRWLRLHALPLRSNPPFSSLFLLRSISRLYRSATVVARKFPPFPPFFPPFYLEYPIRFFSNDEFREGGVVLFVSPTIFTRGNTATNKRTFFLTIIHSFLERKDCRKIWRIVSFLFVSSIIVSFDKEVTIDRFLIFHWANAYVKYVVSIDINSSNWNWSSLRSMGYLQLGIRAIYLL